MLTRMSKCSYNNTHNRLLFFWMAEFENEIDEIEKRISAGESSVHVIAREIAKKYNKKSETIRKAFQRSKEEKNKAHGNRLLTDVEEKRLCAIILAFSAVGMPFTRTMFLTFVFKIWNFVDSWQGDSWF